MLRQDYEEDDTYSPGPPWAAEVAQAVADFLEGIDPTQVSVDAVVYLFAQLTPDQQISASFALRAGGVPLEVIEEALHVVGQATSGVGLNDGIAAAAALVRRF